MKEAKSNIAFSQRKYKRLLKITIKATFKWEARRFNYMCMSMSSSRWSLRNPSLKRLIDSMIFLPHWRNLENTIPINKSIQRFLESFLILLGKFSKKDWESEVISIEEAHDLSKLSTDILIGKFLTYELTLKKREDKMEEK